MTLNNEKKKKFETRFGSDKHANKYHVKLNLKSWSIFAKTNERTSKISSKCSNTLAEIVCPIENHVNCMISCTTYDKIHLTSFLSFQLK